MRFRHGYSRSGTSLEVQTRRRALRIGVFSLLLVFLFSILGLGLLNPFGVSTRPDPNQENSFHSEASKGEGMILSLTADGTPATRLSIEMITKTLLSLPFYPSICPSESMVEGSKILLGEASEGESESQKALRKIFQRFQTVIDRFGKMEDENDEWDMNETNHSRSFSVSPQHRRRRVRFLIPVHHLSYAYLLPLVVSAQVAGIPLELLLLEEPGGANATTGNHNLPGYRKGTFGLMDKWKLVQGFLNRTESAELHASEKDKNNEDDVLEDEDVVILMDGDTVFTGADPLPAIEHFLEHTAPSADELDVLQVRTNGRQEAPLQFSVEQSCFHPAHLSWEQCIEEYDVLEEVYATWTEDQNRRHAPKPMHNKRTSLWNESERDTSSSLFSLWVHKKSQKEHRNPFRYLNSGFVMGRVWAMKQLLEAMNRFVEFRLPKSFPPAYYKCDQSLLGAMYLETLWREWTSGTLLNCSSSDFSTSEKRQDDDGSTVGASLSSSPSFHCGAGSRLSPYGISPGLFSLDHHLAYMLPLNERDAYYFGGEPLGEGLDGLVKQYDRFVSAYPASMCQSFSPTNAVKNDPSSEKCILRRSPTGIPLAPLHLTALPLPPQKTEETWASSGYVKEWAIFSEQQTNSASPLSNSSHPSTRSTTSGRSDWNHPRYRSAPHSKKGGPRVPLVDVSIPLPDRIPFAFHLNGYAKQHVEGYSFLYPWKAPLFAEQQHQQQQRSSEATHQRGNHLKDTESSNRTQKELLRALLWRDAPPIKVWRGSRSTFTHIAENGKPFRNDKEEEEIEGHGLHHLFLEQVFVLHDKPEWVSFLSLCQAHNPKGMRDTTIKVFQESLRRREDQKL